MLEGALTVGAIGIITAVVTKLKWYIKKNGKWTCGCGFTDKNLIDDDEVEVHVEQWGNVHAVFMIPRHKVENEEE